ncbi:GTP-binding protein [Cronobacter dublinensis]|uniref:Bbp19 family protein n=1 Tax=Cronobacter dublinensis TaxID=413497 RepID=UPI0024AF29FE|nr:GTP-binding protein [Cronobacter dublinensis]MDI7502027.1 GTP-binding protein [Cronobacter dublinensis]
MASIKERLFAHKRDRLLLRAYRSVFGEEGKRTEEQRLVIADLMNFSKLLASSVAVSKATGTVDPLATMLAEGRREVAHRIINYTTLDEGQVLAAIQKLNEALTNDV